MSLNEDKGLSINLYSTLLFTISSSEIEISLFFYRTLFSLRTRLAYYNFDNLSFIRLGETFASMRSGVLPKYFAAVADARAREIGSVQPRAGTTSCLTMWSNGFSISLSLSKFIITYPINALHPNFVQHPLPQSTEQLIQQQLPYVV